MTNSKEYNEKYRKANRERLNKQKKDWYNNHKDEYKKYYSANKDKILKRHKETYDKERAKDYHLRNNFGISLEEYNSLFLKQGGKCAICRKHQSKFKRAFSVDHDHKTGQVRGLLCLGCNAGLGCFNEDISRMQKVVEYLRFWEKVKELE